MFNNNYDNIIYVVYKGAFMISYIDSIIGTTYSQNPTEYVLCFMLIVWLTYMFIQLLYSILGISK